MKMKKQKIAKYLFLIFLFGFFIKGFADGIKTPEPQNTIKFTENKGQWDKKVLYRAQLDGGSLFLEKNAFTYNFYDKETLRKNHGGNKKDITITPIRSHAFRMTFLAAEKKVEAISKHVAPDYCNFFIGQDKSKWVGNAKNYKEVNYKNLYSGIDLQILGLQNSMKYNFIVSPLGNTSDIRLFYDGLDKITLEKGSLKIKTSVNELLEQKPYAYQWISGKQVTVPCEFILEKNTVSFSFPQGYDKNIELIIDPVLIFACSSGSTADNFGMTATYDARGNLYSGGTCFDIGFPTTLGAYDATFNGTTAYGRTDVVITKYDSSGTFLQYSTYLGGATGTEIVTSLVVDGQNELLLYGATGSSDFPVTSNAYDQTFNGGTLLHFIYNGSFFDNGTDIYVVKFNATGTALLASTYIGGSMNDGVNVNNDSTLFSWGPPPVYEFPADSLQYNYGDQYRGEINVDAFGNVYIASSTRSGDFPIVNGFDNTLGGKQDAVAFKFNSNLSTLLWSTFLGGSDNDAGYALALDDSTNVYITGGTRSTNFPTTPGVLKPNYTGGKADGFITKINKNGTAILYSTFWGTNQYDQCYFVQLDKNSNVYVVGQTEGAMPITSGVYNNPNSGQFISKMNDSLNTLIYSTVFGNGNGMPNISPSAFLVDYCENVYVSGWGGNIITGVPTTNMPLTFDAIQPSTDGFNFYLFVVSTDAASLLYATYFGGPSSREHVDGGTSRFDKKGIIYQSVCAGCGGNDDFPVTPGSWPYTSPDYTPSSGINMSTNCNNGTFKFDFQIAITDANFTVNHYSGCAPLTVQFHNQSTSGGNYLWDFGNGTTSSTIFDPIQTFTNPGTYLVQLFVNNPASCNGWDSTFQYVTVFPSLAADFGFVILPCTNQATFHDSSALAPISWTWDFGDGNSSSTQSPTHLYNSSGNYTVQLIATSTNGCKDTTLIPLTIAAPAPVTINPSANICLGHTTQLNAAGGFAYSWTPATGLSNPTISNPVANPDSTTTYTVTISTVNSAGDTCIKTLTTTVVVTLGDANFLANNLNGCAPLTVQFNNQSTPGGTFLWDFGNGDTTSTILNPSQTFSTPGTYLVNLYVNNPNSCNVWDTASVTITVYPTITSNFDFLVTPCTNQAAFYDSSAVSPVSWLWNFNDGSTSTVQNPTHVYNTAGTYNVQLISTTAHGCKDTVVVQVVFPGATPVSISPDSTICLGDNLQLNASGGFAYTWIPVTGLNNSNISNPLASPTSTTNYTVTISTINSLGDTCTQTVSTTITVINPATLFISATADKDTIIEGESTIIHAITDTTLTIIWSPATGLSNPNSFNPIATPDVTTTYNVTIVNSSGCTKTATVTIYVITMKCNTDDVFVPNTFTPNEDGQNDILYVRGNELSELYFAVYDRWGELMFETTDITKGWNGIYKGKKCDPAVFAWYLRAKCYSGSELKKQGNVTLIR